MVPRRRVHTAGGGARSVGAGSKVANGPPRPVTAASETPLSSVSVYLSRADRTGRVLLPIGPAALQGAAAAVSTSAGGCAAVARSQLCRLCGVVRLWSGNVGLRRENSVLLQWDLFKRMSLNIVSMRSHPVPDLGQFFWEGGDKGV